MARKLAASHPVARVATQISALSVDLGNAYSNLQADGNISDDWRSVQGVVSTASRTEELPFDS